MIKSAIKQKVPARKSSIARDVARASTPIKRKCRICETRFEKRSMAHVCCSPECAKTFVTAVKKKAERKLDSARKLAIKTRAQWMTEAQAAVNAFVRARDADLPCISCDRHHTGQYHAGHYLGRGAHPAIRFDEANIAKQCQPCNVHLSGNAINFRRGLIARIGQSEVDRLEGPHEAKKYSIDELRAIKAVYRAKLKELQS